MIYNRAKSSLAGGFAWTILKFNFMDEVKSK